MSDLRSKLLGAKTQFKEVTVEHDGDTYVIREMSLKERRNLIKKCQGKDQQLDGTAFQIHSIITSVRDAKGKKVFEDTDAAALEELPATSGFIQVFSEAINKLVAPEEAEGNE